MLTAIPAQSNPGSLAMYAEWLKYGGGVNYLAVPDLPTDATGSAFDLPGGTIFNGALKTVRAIASFEDPDFQKHVSECIAHAWYDGDWTRHPYEEDTVPRYTEYKPDGKYSWIEAPRFNGHPMQVGPLARVLVGVAQGHEPTVRRATKALATAGKVAGTTLTPAVLHSTLGRHAARVIADPEKPLDVLRTVHSFDPCIACAIHTLDREGRELARVRAL